MRVVVKLIPYFYLNACVYLIKFTTLYKHAFVFLHSSVSGYARPPEAQLVSAVFWSSDIPVIPVIVLPDNQLKQLKHLKPSTYMLSRWPLLASVSGMKIRSSFAGRAVADFARMVLFAHLPNG